MAESIGSRIKNAWNAFWNRDPTKYHNVGMGYSIRPDRPRFTRGNERTIITSIINRIALDVAAIDFQHVLMDENDRYKETIKSGLNNCLTLEANLDQSGRALIHDLIVSACDEGIVALVPIDTIGSPLSSDPDGESYDILSVRTAKIIQWYPQHVMVHVYNEQTGRYEDLTLPKRVVTIVENPFFAVMNEPNSTMQRLVRKLMFLDAIDEQSSSGKMDLIIQLPYTIKTDARRQQAEIRRKEIEDQLTGSKYGIAYADGTERITQLNRPLENNLLKQIEYLTSMLYSQLNINQEILDGTANETTMLNYNNRTIKTWARVIVDEMKRKFLTKAAREERQSIMFFTDPFELMPVSQVAEIADKFTRNEIATSNEIRQGIGWKPSSDPKADELRNSNISAPANTQTPQTSNPTVETNDQKVE